ncbi:BRO-N domain-containing protein [Brevibacillus massiliensis]|uniref:BRO-N domain-containing protein n=1 Tax=Brevibacillus massiliensis TaxID=1118054 RepID=UPI0002F53C1E|nr:Bro-N domain-containing protein [Brevibacillus massiliensis]
MKLTLAKTALFGNAQCDFWQNESGDVFMTSRQLGRAIGYADPQKGMDKLVERNPQLKNEEFSVTVKLTGTDGKLYNTRVFNEDGIYEATMLAKTEKAAEFRSWVRKILKSLRKGEVAIVASTDYKQMELEIKRMNAEARLLNARTRQAMLILKSKDGKTLSPQSVELLDINALEVLTDKPIEYRPEVQKTYTAEQIGKELGISKQMVGRIANEHDLKTPEYGIEVLDKSPYSSKQVPSFRYYESGRQAIIEAFKKRKTSGANEE